MELFVCVIQIYGFSISVSGCPTQLGLHVCHIFEQGVDEDVAVVEFIIDAEDVTLI